MTGETEATARRAAEDEASDPAPAAEADDGAAASGEAASPGAATPPPVGLEAALTAPGAVAAGALGAAGLGMVAALGLGFGRTDGLEPWLAAPLALVLTGARLALIERRRGTATAALADAMGRRGGRAPMAYAATAAALGLFALHALLWLLLGLRWAPLGVAAAAAAVAGLVLSGMAYSARADVPRWSDAPTPLLTLALGGAAGFLGLAAVEGLLGFPPGLVVWKAAMALIAAGLAAQLWTSQADEAAKKAAGTPGAPLLSGPFFERGRARAKPIFAASILLGLVIPFVITVAAEAAPMRPMMPLAFLSHIAGAYAFRWLFLAEARLRPAV